MFTAFSWFFQFFWCLPFSGYYPRKAGKVLLPIKHSEHIRWCRSQRHYISCIVLNLCIPILHLFSQLYKRILQIQQMIQKPPPASCHGNRGGSLALFVLFQALTRLLAGVLDRSLSGCQNYRAFGVTVIRYLWISSVFYSISAMIFSKFSSCK